MVERATPALPSSEPATPTLTPPTALPPTVESPPPVEVAAPIVAPVVEEPAYSAMSAPATFVPIEPTAEQAKRDSTGQKYSGETWHPPMVVQNACAGWHPPMAPIAGCP